ncbi:MAG: dihydroorotate dehydrogenase electron transfer subunit [Candidatus Micrarchaeota archaeon]
MDKSVTANYSFPIKIPQPFTISKIETENYRVKTFTFKESLPALPGQFVMVWLPGVDEKPLGVSSERPLSISFANVGRFSDALSKLEAGDKVGISGPFGAHFELRGKSILLVAGGYGVVPLHFLAQEARKEKIKTTAIIGAKTAKDVLFENKLAHAGSSVSISTDDGSKGFKGNAVQLAEQLISKNKFDAIYSCGPEKMMFHLAKLAERHKIPCYVSADRYMKCAVGVCGACTIGGYMSCRDGPVMDSRLLEKTEDWGNFHRDKSGKKVKL